MLVSDTGPGLPPNKVEQLFVPFERLGADQTGIEGTGLGLALSKALTEAMGGQLGVESVVGQGSTFWLEFPLVASPVEQAERAADPLPVPIELDGTRQPLLVLCVEDNLTNFKLIQRLLSHRPEVRLLPVLQGALGVEMAHTHRPHLILLDLHLPDLPGGEVLRLLRASPTTRDIPVVVISADATAGQIERLLAAGATAYLSKPIDVRRLLELFDGFLDERSKDSREARADG
jgi:CheY-like chemotaxis protein